jgi:hypothetical protein
LEKITSDKRISFGLGKIFIMHVILKGGWWGIRWGVLRTMFLRVGGGRVVVG